MKTLVFLGKGELGIRCAEWFQRAMEPHEWRARLWLRLLKTLLHDIGKIKRTQAYRHTRRPRAKARD